MLSEAAPQPAAPRPRWGRRVALGGVAVLVLLVLVLIACESAGWPFLRGPLERQLAQRLDAPVRIGEPFRLRLLQRPGLEAASLHIGSPDAFGVPHLVQAEGVSLSWRWRDWFQRADGSPWLLQTLQAQQLDAHLVRQADGRVNFGLPPPPPGAASAPTALPVQAQQFALQAGRLHWRDAPLQVELDSRFSWQEGGSDAAGRFRAQAEGRWRGTPFDLRAESPGLLPLLAAGGPARPMVPVELQLRVGTTEARFRGLAAELMGSRALHGSLLVRGPSLAPVGQALGITLPATPPFRLAGALRHDAGLWGLVATEAHIGGSRLVADLQVDTRGARPQLTGSLGGPLLRLKDLGPAVGAAVPRDAPLLPTVLDADGPAPVAAAAIAAPGAPRRAGRVLPDRSFDLPSLRAMDADVRVAIARLDLGNDTTIAPLRQLRTQLTLQQGVLTLDKLYAQVAGGTVQGLTRLDAAKPEQPAQWRADLRFAGVRLEQWLPVLKRATPGARDTAKGTPTVPLASGLLDARVDVRGAGRSTAAILGSLQGLASAQVRQGMVSHLVVEMAGLDLAQGLGVWLTGDKPLPLTCARVDAQLSTGVAVLRRAVFDTNDSTLRAKGRIDLRNESLALRVEVAPKDFSPLSLRVPIVVGGSLASPDVGIESGRLAPKLLAAAALALAAPLAALLPLLEFGSSGDKTPQGCPP